MQSELLFTTEPIINPKGYNQFVKILAIQDKTYQHRYFESMSQCSKALKAGVREISRISIGKLYTCANGWTYIRVNEGTNLEEEIKCFQQKRNSLNISKIPNKKVCSKCGIEKPFNSDYFHKNKSKSKYGKLMFKGICKECRKGEHKTDYKNRKIRIENDEDLRAVNIFNIYKKIDKKKGLKFDLTIQWINDNIINGKCFYCGFSDNMGIDRIRNDVGHVIENCIPCCKICNITRMDNFTHEEFVEIGLVIKKIKTTRNELTTK